MRIRTLATLATLALVAVSGAASAHASQFTSDGKFKVTFGFLNEPAVTWTKTGLDLIITDNATGGPVDGADKTLNATLLYNDQSHPFHLAPQFGTHGRYTDTITMTEPGLYKLHLTGTINGTAVDLTIPAKDETPDINATYFPDHPGDLNAMKARLDAMQAQIDALNAKLKQQAETTTPVSTTTSGGKPAPAPGAVAAVGVLGAAALALAIRRRV